MRTAAIIQARMGSSRLPGKVLQSVAGKPVMWHIVHRLRKCREVDDVIIATSTNAIDDPLVDFARSMDAPIVRGPEDDVLTRYLMAARQFDADYIVRVTGDSPLVDPVIIDAMLAAMKKDGADICEADSQGQIVIHEGFTPMSRRALEAQEQFAGHDPAVREHVAVDLRKNVPDVKAAWITFSPDHFFEGARISVDTPADLEFMNTVYGLLGAAPGEADVADVVALLRRRPELLSINAHVRQKSADDYSHTVLFRCDGGRRMGMGHVMRCLSLAQTLRDRYSVGSRFAVRAQPDPDDAIAETILRAHHFPCHVLDARACEALQLAEIAGRQRCDAIIYDIRTDLSPDDVARLRDKERLAVCIDDPSDRRLACDLAFYPPVPQVRSMSWTGFTGTLHVGWEWVLLNPSFSRERTPVPRGDVPRVLVSMGGADPQGMIFTVLDALARVRADFEAHVVLGHAFRETAAVDKVVERFSVPIHIHRNVEDMAGLMSGMEMAVASFGVTAYELAASCVPSILLCLTEDHALAAQAFSDAGVSVSLGLHKSVTENDLATRIERLLTDGKLRRDMSRAAEKLAPRTGVGNVAAALKSALDKAVSHGK
ncbi:MAG: NTP transferase domain-containing protein [Alphaproteobacteria bacterium]|nr:NTP transferase domain-containing protein [Alphaproteobacteria bacterium]